MKQTYPGSEPNAQTVRKQPSETHSGCLRVRYTAPFTSIYTLSVTSYLPNYLLYHNTLYCSASYVAAFPCEKEVYLTSECALVVYL